VRRAIAHAINVPFFIDNFSAISPSSAPGRSPRPRPTSIPAPTHRNSYDKAKAAALLDEAGFKPGTGGTRFR